MRFASVLPATLALFLAANGALAAPGEGRTPGEQVAAVVEPVAARSEAGAEPLEKRQCSANGCRCDSRGRQFRSCGNCVWTDTGSWVITAKRDLTHVYECAPDGGCCDYGFANDCGGPDARCYLQ
jgi:hypothetical protein